MFSTLTPDLAAFTGALCALGAVVGTLSLVFEHRTPRTVGAHLRRSRARRFLNP